MKARKRLGHGLLRHGCCPERDIPITEYAPLKIKMAITGNGQASKEQVADMLQRMLHFPKEEMPVFMDATDGLAAAYCHFLQMGRPVAEKGYHAGKTS